MRRILSIYIPIALAGISMLSACKKTNDYPSHTALVSFPVVTLKGSQDTTISRGATWSDPGATWHDSITGETGTLKATTVVSTSTDSAYLLVYTATNKNGFQTYATRGLGVTNYSGSIDMSGGYTDSQGDSVVITKVSRALFALSNSDYYGDPAVIVIKSDSTISVSSVSSTLVSGTTGAPIPVSFSGASATFQPAYYYSGVPPRLIAEPTVLFSYVITALNVPPYSLSFTRDLY